MVLAQLLIHDILIFCTNVISLPAPHLNMEKHIMFLTSTLVPAPHFNVVYSGQQRIPRNRFNDFILRETIKMVRVERGHFKTTMLKHDAGSIGDTWHPDILRQCHIFASTSFEYGKTYYAFNQHPLYQHHILMWCAPANNASPVIVLTIYFSWRNH
jgi:hypothetical protein